MSIGPISPGGSGELPPERRKGVSKKEKPAVRKRVEKTVDQTAEEIRKKALNPPGEETGTNYDEEA